MCEQNDFVVVYEMYIKIFKQNQSLSEAHDNPLIPHYKKCKNYVLTK